MKIRNVLLFLLLTAALPVAAAEVGTRSFAVAPDNLIQPLGSANQIVIPAAGSTPGNLGTFFRSEINIINYAPRDQRIRLRWLPQGQSGVGLTAQDMTIRASSGVQSEDFVASVLGQSGLGAILISAITAEGALDTSAQLYATSRIWTPQPGTNGTTSQTFPTIPTSALTGARASMIGLKRDDRYRVNVGVVNLDSASAQTYRVILAGNTPTLTPEVSTVTVQPLSMQQISLVGPAHASIQIAVTNESLPVNSPLWISYGSSVDNVTGDSWSMIGFGAP